MMPHNEETRLCLVIEATYLLTIMPDRLCHEDRQLLALATEVLKRRKYPQVLEGKFSE